MADEQRWIDTVKKHLVGRTIVDVFYMIPTDAEKYDWLNRPIVLRLDDGNFVFPMMDDEGNDGGALATTYEDINVVPVWRD